MSHRSFCDVAVVGAGPAGATAACLLAGKGYDVRLIDKRDFPRPKLCAGLLTWKTIVLLRDLFGESVESLRSAGIITHSCHAYRIFAGTREIARGRLNFPFHFVHRERYDHHWVKLARAAGARVSTGTAVEKVAPCSGRITLVDGRSVQASLIIGADGVWSSVRKAMPGSDRRFRENLAATVETWLAPDRMVPAMGNVATLHFGFIPWGYAWNFPGSERRTLGMAGLVRKSGPPFLDAFRRFLSVATKAAQTPSQLKGYPLPYGSFPRQLAYQRALLIGDAGGLADPLLGEGIYYAHSSARIAVRAICENGLQPVMTAKAYQAELNRRVLRELRWLFFLRTALFLGGHRRRYRGLKLCCALFPKRLEACVQGQRSFSRLFFP